VGIYFCICPFIAVGLSARCYLADVMQAKPMKSDAFLNGLSNRFMLFSVSSKWDELAAIFGCFCTEQYFTAWRKCHILMTQAWLPLNPDHIPNMNWDLALHTTISFLTNTNQQHYSGQSQLSYLSQMTVIVGLQYLSPIMGLALLVAMLRALFLQSQQQDLIKTNGID
jgi:K+-transporting ATPase ATPase A chain